MRRSFPAPALLVALTVCAGDHTVGQVRTVFTNATATSGIQFQHTDSPDTMAGGLCLLDYDGDGDQDVFVTARGGTPNALFRNRGDGTFVEAAAAAGVRDTLFSMGAYAQDFDQDGWTDLLVLAMSGTRIYRNRGNGTFENVTVRSRLPLPTWPISATFADYDRDGDLDVYVGNYVGDGFFPYLRGLPNELWRNDGGMVFTDVTAAAGVSGVETWIEPNWGPRTSGGSTLSVLFHDFNNDGWADIFVGNDFGPYTIPNQLFRNDRNGRFTEVAAFANFRIPEYNMGLCLADVNGDGEQDIYTSNFGANHLLLNDGRGRYFDANVQFGVEEHHGPGGVLVSWAAMFLDANLDRRPDLYVSNGYIHTVASMPNDPNAPSRLLVHNGVRYDVVPEPDFPWDRGVGRGAACGDLDGDGDEDLIQLNNRGPVRVYRNDTVSSHRAALIDLVGTRSNRDAVGARLTLRSRSGRQSIEYARGGSYGSGNGARIIRGLGDDPRIEELTVAWPSGTVSRRHGLEGDLVHQIREPLVTFTTGNITPVGADFIEVPLFLVNHASTAVPIAVVAEIVFPDGSRFQFPAYHLPTTVGGGAGATLPVWLPIPAAILPLARQLGVWVNLVVFDATGGRDEVEQPVW